MKNQLTKSYIAVIVAVSFLLSPLGVSAVGVTWDYSSQILKPLTAVIGSRTSVGTTTASTNTTLTVSATSTATTNILSLINSSGQIVFYVSAAGVASSTTFQANGLATCQSGSFLTWSGGTFGCAADSVGSTAPEFVPDMYNGVAVNATTTGIWFKATSPFSLVASSTFATYASSTQLTVSGNTYLSGITSAIALTGADGLIAEYAGTSCTNQFPRSLSALGAATCASVANTDLTNSTISGVALGSNLAALTNDATLSGSSYNGSGAISDWGLNLGNANTWTALQQFSNASSTQLTVTSTGRLYVPAGADPTIAATGDVAINTTTASSSIRYYDGTAERALYDVQYRTFTIASSTWLAAKGATASSTIPIGTASPQGETWTERTCYTDSAGTAEVELGDGTNWMPYQLLTTTRSTNSTATNNTFTAYEKRYIRVGRTATAPDYITCSVGIRENAP